MAADLKISNISLRRIVKNDLQMKYRARAKVPLLTRQQKEKRLKRTKAIFNDVKHDAAGKTILFTDEKIFTVDAAANRRNGQ